MLKTLELLKSKLIKGYDILDFNSPHHKHIKTFPHHKHTPKIEESKEVSLEEVLGVIEEKLKII